MLLGLAKIYICDRWQSRLKELSLVVPGELREHLITVLIFDLWISQVKLVKIR